MIFRQNRFLTAILALGVLGAAWALAGRHSVEMSNRAVEIAVDYSEVAELAGAARLTVPETLSRLKKAGATSVAIQERTVADLAASGMVNVMSAGGTGTYLQPVSPDVLEALKASGIRLDIPAPTASGAATVHIDAEPDYVLALTVGLPEEALAAAKQAGMQVVARLVNYPGVRRENVERTAARLKRDGVGTVIFAGDEVLGFRGGVREVAEAFKGQGLIFGSVEFAKQKGDRRLSELTMPNVIRVHSITAAEMGTLDRPTAVERFVKAAKERDVRLAYVRMFDFGDADPLKANEDYIKSIANRLWAKGFGVRAARPFENVTVPLPAAVLMAIGAAAGVILLVVSVVRLAPGLMWGGFVVIAVIFAGLAATGVALALKLVALAAAVTFPTLAVLYAAWGAPTEPRGGSLRPFMWQAASQFAGAVVVSGAGGFIIAGLLSRGEFMLRIDQFAGVKVAHIVPILLIAFALAAGIGWRPDGWREQKERAAASLRRLAAQPVLMWQTGLALILLVMLALVLARSGNEPGVGVSNLELRFRGILDTLLFVRPRTKEFLMGHPALLLGIAAALGGRRNWAAVLLVVGAIGEVSLVNTFCHIHTPVALSVMRSVMGAVLGLAIGLVLLLLFSRPEKNGVPGRSAEDAGRERAGVRK